MRKRNHARASTPAPDFFIFRLTPHHSSYSLPGPRAPVQTHRLAVTMSSKQDAKVVILGASGCGKTCLSLRFVKDQFISCAVPRPTALPRPKAD